MAESSGNPQLEVNIGGDISQLQASIIAAENELRGFQAEIKKTTDTGKIAELSAKIETTTQKIAGMRQEMGKSAGASDKAVNALGNVSRVAQDASYGFMGIANNLNPLFESFQRLQKDAGGTGNALKQMGAALTGPAGIGLGIAVVSSLIVSFGDDIAEFVKKTTGGTAAMVEFGKAFSGAKDAFTTAYVEMENLNSSFDQFHNGTKSKKSVLDEYNASLGKVYGTTKDIAEAERLFIENKDNYVQAALYRAAGQIALKKAAEEAFKQLEAQNAPSTANKTSMFMGEGLGAIMLSKFTGAPAITATDVLGSTAIAKKAKEQEVLFKGIFDQFQQLANEQDKLATKSKDFGKDVDKDPVVNYAREMNKELNLELAKMKALRDQFAKLDLKPILTVFNPEADKEEQKRKQYFEKQSKENLEQSNKSGLGDFLQKDSQKRIEAYKLEEKQLKELQQTQEDFANSVADFGANAFRALFTTLENGGDVLETLGNLFKQLAMDIAAAAIRAAIFEAIMAAIDISSGGGASAAKGGGNILKSIFGFAEGGIVTKPTLGLIGEAGQNEAIIPLSKLNSFMKTSFNAGSMAGNGGGNGGGGVAVLRGQDLLISINRTQRASALKGQNISLL
jgi:hypothetical protein